MNKIITLAAPLLLFSAVFTYNKLSYDSTDGFSKSFVEFDLPYKEEWNVLPITSEKESEVDSLLSKHYTYLGKGARSYAFLSEDGETVLKFFKYRYHQPHWMVRYLPDLPLINYFRKKKLGKVSLDTVLTGYKNAYDYDREGTGLLYVHLNETKEKHPVIKVSDKSGHEVEIDLDRARFVLQKKVEEAEDVLARLLEAGDVQTASERIAQIFDLYHSQHAKGLIDLGNGILRNNGFDGSQAIHFDVGKLVKKRDNPSDKMIHMAKKVELWVEIHYPEYREEIVQTLNHKLFELYGVNNDL